MVTPAYMEYQSFEVTYAIWYVIESVHVVQVVINLEEAEQGTTVLRLHHTGIPHEDKYGNSDVEGTTRHGWQNLILHRIKAVFGYGL